MTSQRQRLPSWLIKPFGFSENVHHLKKELRDRRLHTVCEEARCPNLGECWAQKTATLMILGDVCTRHCGFCSIQAGVPQPVDPDEPRKVAEIVRLLGLKHVVITCVARDDLPDIGASHFVRVIEAIRAENPGCSVEILTTDFQMKPDAVENVCRAKPDVFNHNIETVERLTSRVRHRATYEHSLAFLKMIKNFDPTLTTKSGMMLGLGETREEVSKTLSDLIASGVQVLTVGQYLQPTTSNLAVVEYVRPEIFEDIEQEALALGFQSVASGPFVRSSYHAGEMIGR